MKLIKRDSEWDTYKYPDETDIKVFDHDEEPPHSTDEGSVTYYRQGCRCEGCRRVASAARKRLRQGSPVPVGGEG